MSGTGDGPAPAGDAVPAGAGPRRLANLLFYATAVFFFVYLSRYYVTGAGGPTLLAVAMVPVAFALVVLNDLRRGDFYPRLGPYPAFALGLLYIAVALAAATYLLREFDAIRIYRMGFWNNTDLVAGGAMAALILEYTRRRYLALFVVNVLLVLYTVYGYLVPGMFRHPGLPWRRVVSAVSVEIATGIFERLPQLGLTLIGSFMLVLAVLRAFGCIDSILQGSARIAARSPRLLPQAAVLGSFAVAAVSGSGAANAATTGSATIPALIKAGFPRVKAAAVETATSLGGQLMPPLMGVAAFLMAELMGRSYFEVVARGFAPAIVYFIGVAAAVYLLACRFQRRTVILDVPPLLLRDRLNILAYLLAIGGLIYLMGVARRPAMSAAQTTFVGLFVVLLGAYLAGRLWERRLSLRELIGRLASMVETFATNTAELTMLLSTLGILTATFTITGVPDKVGVLLLQLASANLLLMVLTAFGFGYLIGMGLPVAPTYIVTAVVIAPFMVRAGIDPWVVHFFAFLVAVFGELSPPTSVTAAVTSRIAEAPFVRTMFDAIGLALPLLVLMGAVFTRPELIVEPGVAQLPAFALVLVGTLGLIFALQAHFFRMRAADLALRALLGLLACLTLFHPGPEIAFAAALPTLAMVALGFVRSRGLDVAASPAAGRREPRAPGDVRS